MKSKYQQFNGKSRREIESMVLNMQASEEQYEDALRNQEHINSTLVNVIHQLFLLTYPTMRDTDALHRHYRNLATDFKIDAATVDAQRADFIRRIEEEYAKADTEEETK